MNTEFHDAQWHTDYAAALDELMGRPRLDQLKPRLLLPAPPEVYDEDNPYDVVPLSLPRPVLSPYNVPVQEHVFNPESRSDVLRLLVVRKTAKPGLRLVMANGEEIGKIARAFSLGWLASTRRGQVFYSIADACLALFEDHAEAVR